MLAYVISRHGKPLMPTTPPKARHLLKHDKAKVVSREPFTIKLLYGSSDYKQEVVAGMDTGSKIVGCAAITNAKVLYQSEVRLRDDVSGKMQQRAMYRRNRRNRKTRYRPARWNNRASMRQEGRLAPSIKSKVDSHLRERDFVESILPVTRWKVELAAFDIHKITNPEVFGVVYQKRHVAKGDYQQTTGKRSEQRIPTGKLFGLRKFDLIRTPKAIGFVKGKRARGYFVLMNINGDIIADTSVKKNVTRISARSTTLTERRAFLSSQTLAGVPSANI